MSDKIRITLESITPETHTELVQLCIDGLSFDGGHHKQYYLREMLDRLVGKAQAAALDKDHYWEEGVRA